MYAVAKVINFQTTSQNELTEIADLAFDNENRHLIMNSLTLMIYTIRIFKVSSVYTQDYAEMCLQSVLKKMIKCIFKTMHFSIHKSTHHHK